METVRIEDIDPRRVTARAKRSLSDPLSTTALALNHYELAPGDSFAFGYHAHEHQEEVFYVLSGTATFETEDGSVAIGPDEAIRFGPGEFQRGWNRGDEPVVALALGAPREAGELEMRWDCPDCQERTRNRITGREEAVVTVCEACGTETQRFER